MQELLHRLPDRGGTREHFGSAAGRFSIGTFHGRMWRFQERKFWREKRKIHWRAAFRHRLDESVIFFSGSTHHLPDEGFSGRLSRTRVGLFCRSAGDGRKKGMGERRYKELAAKPVSRTYQFPVRISPYGGNTPEFGAWLLEWDTLSPAIRVLRAACIRAGAKT